MTNYLDHLKNFVLNKNDGLQCDAANFRTLATKKERTNYKYFWAKNKHVIYITVFLQLNDSNCQRTMLQKNWNYLINCTNECFCSRNASPKSFFVEWGQKMKKSCWISMFHPCVLSPIIETNLMSYKKLLFELVNFCDSQQYMKNNLSLFFES